MGVRQVSPLSSTLNSDATPGRYAPRTAQMSVMGQEAVADGRSAAAVMREIAPLVGGGGGGRETMARAGGKDPSRLPEALARAEELLRGE